MQINHQTPHLVTAANGPVNIVEQHIIDREELIEQWFQSQWKLTPPPIYGSVDLRNAGFKLAPVDMNLFPAGFNNLNPEFLSLATDAFKQALPNIHKILILAESHTRNVFYWKNLRVLLTILQEAQFEVRVGTLLSDFKLPSEMSEGIILQTISREENKIKVGDFIPEMILLNNDLSEGIPDILQNLSQPIMPPAELGWNQRLKSQHFQHYADVAEEFANLVEIDPWFIAPQFRHCGELDFMKREGEKCLIEHVENLFTAIEKKYQQYHIPYKPFVIVKADAGTYGMAVMTIRNAEELRSLNRKQRTHMAKTKGGQLVSRVILQEGVYTFETLGEQNSVAEPVVYLCGERVIGGFYRVHKDRGMDENLNAPGMHFEPLAFLQRCDHPDAQYAMDDCQNRFYIYGVIARLSMLAAAREMAEKV